MKTTSQASRRLLTIRGHVCPHGETQVSVTQRTLHSAPCSADSSPFARNTSQDPLSGPSTLKAERSRCTFCVREMTYLLDGGEKMTLKREKVMKELGEHKAFTGDEYDLSTAEKRERTASKILSTFRLLATDTTDIEVRNARVEIHSMYDMDWYIRQGVHFGLFMGAIMSSGTDDQKAEWLMPTLMLQMFGCFAMTELGHGSFLRGIETTAEYDASTEEFIINTPTDTATKWWIGGAGQTATHAAVFARLFLQGRDKGVQTFIVPLRDVETHKPLPSVRVGDCGAKMGLNGIDNGWIQFDHTRIPRENMLMRYAEVTPDGTFIKPPSAQMAYGALIGTRGFLVCFACNVLKKALMIAVRFGAIRRQGGNDDGTETQLLDYQSHQYRLMRLLARAYAFHWMGAYTTRLSEHLDEGLDNDDLSVLPDVHGTMAGLKAFTTWYAHRGLEECRQACGGHGYSLYNGLSSLVTDFAVFCTFEGDNTVMALQTARYLVSSYKRYKAGETMQGSVKYFEVLSSATPRWPINCNEDVMSCELQLAAMRYAAAVRVAEADKRIEDARSSGHSEERAWSAAHVDLIAAAEAHVLYNIAVQFVKKVTEVSAIAERAREAKVLKELCDLFILDRLEQDAAFFLRMSYMRPNDIDYIHEKILELCASTRQNAVPLVDAFNYSDSILQSAIGRADGDIYTAYLERVNAISNLKSVPEYYEREIKPIFANDVFQ